MPPITRNALFYGDNLPILRRYIDNESVDLIYLDPPFNSNRSYNVLFKDESGQESEAQITAFEDTWHWTAHTEEVYYDLATLGDPPISSMIGALRESIGTNQMMAYLVMMAARLVELHRVLKPTGSLYLHCDPTASHYLKLLLDAIFGPEHFHNEVIWKRTHAHGSAKRWGDVHDILLFYTKTHKYTWCRVLQDYDASYVEGKYRFHDKRGQYRLVVLTAPGTTGGASGKSWRGYNPTVAGRHWAVPRRALADLEARGADIPTDLQAQLDLLYEHDFIRIPKKKDGSFGVPESKLYLRAGQPLQDLIHDIPPINSQARERLGYPTQKPVALLERIIRASSNPGDVVLDPFCGCGTTIAGAQQLDRRWIGSDITHLSIALQKYRLKDSFELVEKKDYDVIGEPEDFSSALQLAEDDRYQFQWWALSLIKARPLGGQSGSRRGKKGSDKGIDNVIAFIDDKNGKPKRILVQVKSGKVKSGDIRDLRGAVEREEAAMGIFITLGGPQSRWRPRRPARASTTLQAGTITIPNCRSSRLPTCSTESSLKCRPRPGRSSRPRRSSRRKRANRRESSGTRHPRPLFHRHSR